jgi:hypothetical protein
VDKDRKPEQIEIFYEKNPLYRTIHADGVIGGPTPNNFIYLGLYASRRVIPKSMLHEVNSDSTLNPIGTPKDTKSGIFREIEVGVYMSKDTAKDMYEFLKKIFE